MTRKRVVPLAILGVCLGIGLYTLNLARTKALPTNTKQTTDYKGQITSCAKSIKVIKAEVIDGTINVQVENLSDLGIIAISLEATNGIETYTTTHRSSFKEDKPLVVIQPHSTGNLTMTSQFGQVPLLIGGVMYDDGSEDGCESSLKTLHEVKDYEKKKEPLNETNPHGVVPPNP